MNVGVDQVARNSAGTADAKAQRALDEIAGHEDLCALRYGNIDETLKRIIRILGWAGTTVFALLISTLGWLIVQQVDHNDTDKAKLSTQVQVLQQQLDDNNPRTQGR